MRASSGALSHDDIMRLTWRQFETYQEAFTYLSNMESEEGRKRNDEADRQFERSDDGFDEQVEKDRIEAYRRIGKKPPPKGGVK